MAGPGTHCFYIGNHHQRIGRRLDKDSLRLRTAGCLQPVKIIGIHIGGRDSVLGQNPFQKTIGSAIQVKGHDKVVALPE
ncbi:hypothetical protein D3C80_1856380 [compost metagenome]